MGNMKNEDHKWIYITVSLLVVIALSFMVVGLAQPGPPEDCGEIPEKPCSEAVWKGYPYCIWDESDCAWQPTWKCPMTCEDGRNIEWTWKGECANIYDRLGWVSMNYGCSYLYDDGGFLDMLCSCGICSGTMDDGRYKCPGEEEPQPDPPEAGQFCNEKELEWVASSFGGKPQDEMIDIFKTACLDYTGTFDTSIYHGPSYVKNTAGGNYNTITCHLRRNDNNNAVKLFSVKVFDDGSFMDASWTSYATGLCFKYQM